MSSDIPVKKVGDNLYKINKLMYEKMNTFSVDHMLYIGETIPYDRPGFLFVKFSLKFKDITFRFIYMCSNHNYFKELIVRNGNVISSGNLKKIEENGYLDITNIFLKSDEGNQFITCKFDSDNNSSRFVRIYASGLTTRKQDNTFYMDEVIKDKLLMDSNYYQFNIHRVGNKGDRMLFNRNDFLSRSKEFPQAIFILFIVNLGEFNEIVFYKIKNGLVMENDIKPIDHNSSYGLYSSDIKIDAPLIDGYVEITSIYPLVGFEKEEIPHYDSTICVSYRTTNELNNCIIYIGKGTFISQCKCILCNLDTNNIVDHLITVDHLKKSVTTISKWPNTYLCLCCRTILPNDESLRNHVESDFHKTLYVIYNLHGDIVKRIPRICVQQVNESLKE